VILLGWVLLCYGHSCLDLVDGVLNLQVVLLVWRCSVLLGHTDELLVVGRDDVRSLEIGANFCCFVAFIVDIRVVCKSDWGFEEIWQ
jgi:hypothetical protein